jgi:hypothetical protein
MVCVHAERIRILQEVDSKITPLQHCGGERKTGLNLIAAAAAFAAAAGTFAVCCRRCWSPCSAQVCWCAARRQSYGDSCLTSQSSSARPRYDCSCPCFVCLQRGWLQECAGLGSMLGGILRVSVVCPLRAFLGNGLIADDICPE